MIINANMRDMTFIASQMRKPDIDEIMCQYDENTTPQEVAMRIYDMCPPDTRFVAYDPQKDMPAMAFGAVPTFNPALWGVWAFGTDRMIRAVPEATKYINYEFIPYFTKKYAPRRIEVRTLVDHDLSHNWLHKLGARPSAYLANMGRDGEDFVLYEWFPRQKDATLGWTTPTNAGKGEKQPASEHLNGG